MSKTKKTDIRQKQHKGRPLSGFVFGVSNPKLPYETSENVYKISLRDGGGDRIFAGIISQLVKRGMLRNFRREPLIANFAELGSQNTPVVTAKLTSIPNNSSVSSAVRAVSKKNRKGERLKDHGSALEFFLYSILGVLSIVGIFFSIFSIIAGIK